MRALFLCGLFVIAFTPTAEAMMLITGESTPSTAEHCTTNGVQRQLDEPISPEAGFVFATVDIWVDATLVCIVAWFGGDGCWDEYAEVTTALWAPDVPGLRAGAAHFAACVV